MLKDGKPILLNDKKTKATITVYFKYDPQKKMAFITFFPSSANQDGGSFDGNENFRKQFEDICKNLKDLTLAFEGKDGWQFELPSDLESPQTLTSAIVAFTVVPEKITSKFKLSQNRQAMDREGVVEGLAARTDDMSKAIRDLMK